MLFTTALAVATIVSASGASLADYALPGNLEYPYKRQVANGIRIGWDRGTLSRVSGKQFKSAGYARMVELRDGVLLCVYEADGSIMAARSADGGESWSDTVPVAWHQDGINMAAPDVIQLADGSILCCYNPRPWKISGTRTFGIRTRKSYDGGKTWIHGRLLYEAGHKFRDGCWEPSAIQLPDGEIQVYFANEGPYRKSNEQNISMLRSTDGGLTWSEKPAVVSFRRGARDGMPAPLLLNSTAEIVVAIEDLGWLGYFKPAILRTPADNAWTEPVGALHPNRDTALGESIGHKTYAGAPYLRQLPTGETLLSYQGTEGRNNTLHNAEMKVTIGDPNARSFNRKSVPFDIPPRSFALWNSLTVLRDGSVVALTSTNAFSFMRSEVWMIRGYIIPEVIAARGALTVDGYEIESAWDEAMPLFTRRDGKARLNGGVCYDDEFLYLYSHIKDDDVSCESADLENNDGVGVSLYWNPSSLDSEFAPSRPDPHTHKIFLSADNHLIVKTGDDERWMYRDSAGLGIRHKSRKTRTGYFQELGVPWRAIGGKPAPGKRIGLNISVTQSSGSNIPAYRESLSGNHEDKPYSWLTLRLQ